jgi:hypothetical protein
MTVVTESSEALDSNCNDSSAWSGASRNRVLKVSEFQSGNGV